MTARLVTLLVAATVTTALEMTLRGEEPDVDAILFRQMQARVAPATDTDR